MSAEAGSLVMYRNVTKGAISFPCGTDRKQAGYVVGTEAGVPMRKPVYKTVERVLTVKAGDVIGIEEGYTLPRGGIKVRPSYLEEAGLVGKLVPVEGQAS